MTTIAETSILSAVQTVNEYLSNYVLVFLLLGVGIWYTVKTRFVQIRCFKEGWNKVFGNLTLNPPIKTEDRQLKKQKRNRPKSKMNNENN